MRQVLPFIGMLVLSQHVSSQDTLYLKNQPPALVKIIRIDGGYIQYQKANNRQPVLPVTTKRVDSIHFENGEKTNFLEGSGLLKFNRRAHSREPRTTEQNGYKNEVEMGIGALVDTYPFKGKSWGTVPFIGALHMNFERQVFPRVGISISPHLGLNWRYFSGFLSAHYYLINLKSFRLGVGPTVGFGYQNLRINKLDSPKEPVYQIRELTNHRVLAGSLRLQHNLAARTFLNHELTMGQVRFHGYSEEHIVIGYKVGFGFRF